MWIRTAFATLRVILHVESAWRKSDISDLGRWSNLADQMISSPPARTARHLGSAQKSLFCTPIVIVDTSSMCKFSPHLREVFLRIPQFHSLPNYSRNLLSVQVFLVSRVGLELANFLPSGRAQSQIRYLFVTSTCHIILLSYRPNRRQIDLVPIGMDRFRKRGAIAVGQLVWGHPYCNSFAQGCAEMDPVCQLCSSGEYSRSASHKISEFCGSGRNSFRMISNTE